MVSARQSGAQLQESKLKIHRNMVSPAEKHNLVIVMARAHWCKGARAAPPAKKCFGGDMATLLVADRGGSAAKSRVLRVNGRKRQASHRTGTK